jgi:NADPH-dependent 2,4-dienoyl-CoA reductase/sulfur reductase-like enzyme
VLRTVDEARALRAGLRAGASVVVVGAGWIGAEVATAAAKAGCRVTALEAGQTPLPGALPGEVGALTTSWWAAAGVQLRTGARVDALERGSVHLVGGERLLADVVVVGVGVRPSTDWLVGSGVPLTPGGAVEVDGDLRCGVPEVFAVGDAAAWWSARYGRRLHVEHWDTALHAPTVVAAGLLGMPAVYDPVPYFWSEQFGRTLQVVGYPPAGERLVWRGDPHRDATWALAWLAGDRLVALLCVDRPRDLVQARRLMQRDVPVDADRLADPAVPVKESLG